MSRLLPGVVGAAALALLVPCPAPACILCGSAASQQTLRMELEQAKLVLYGTVANPRLNTDENAPPGSGTSDLQILKVLKDNPILGGRKVLELKRYLPVIDPKDPPKLLVFCDIVDGKLDSYLGRSASPALLAYLDGARAQQGKPRSEALLYFFPFLASTDEAVANDAYLEFAHSSDQEVGEAARHLPAEKLRGLLEDPKTPTSRLGLYAFMLGVSGEARDAELLRSMIERPTDRTAGALDGLLGGYITLRPEEGWDLVVSLLGDHKRSFPERLAVTRTLKFYHSWKPAESRKQLLRALGAMIPDGDVADLAFEDLRHWQMWDLTDRVLAQYGKPSHAAPVMRRAICRYALCCPLPEARLFVQEVRRQDPRMIQELEEAINFEKQR